MAKRDLRIMNRMARVVEKGPAAGACLTVHKKDRPQIPALEVSTPRARLAGKLESHAWSIVT